MNESMIQINHFDPRMLVTRSKQHVDEILSD